jgi:hypothetical protein
MKTVWKKTLIAALPLAGLLLTAPAAFAHIHHHHPYYRGYRHECHPSYGRGWHERRRYGDDYRPGWYGGRRYNDGDDDYRSRYPQQPYDGPWWQGFFYR